MSTSIGPGRRRCPEKPSAHGRSERRVRVPGADIDARVLSLWGFSSRPVASTEEMQMASTPLSDRLLDQLQLGGNVRGRSADVVNGQTPIGTYFCAPSFAASKNEFGNLRDEGDGHAVHRALAFGKSGGARVRAMHSTRSIDRIFFMFGFLLRFFIYLKEWLDSAP